MLHVKNIAHFFLHIKRESVTVSNFFSWLFMYRISLTLSSDVFIYKNIPSFGFRFPFLDMGTVRRS